jgi:hypothetical protein
VPRRARCADGRTPTFRRVATGVDGRTSPGPSAHRQPRLSRLPRCVAIHRRAAAADRHRPCRPEPHAIAWRTTIRSQAHRRVDELRGDPDGNHTDRARSRRERAVFRREQAAGLSASAYLLAKTIVFSAVAVIQSAILVLIVTAPAIGKPVPSVQWFWAARSSSCSSVSRRRA